MSDDRKPEGGLGPMGARETRFFGAPVRRLEDRALLTGTAQFIDDIELPHMLHAAVYRSPMAHARIRSLDVEAARGAPGVVAVYTAADLGDYWQPGPLLVPPPPVEALERFHERTQVPLARDVVRYVGEPVALVVADSRYLAEDALELIEVDLEPVDPVVDLEAALEDGASRVHDDLDDNVAAHVVQRKGLDGDDPAAWRRDWERIEKDAHAVVRRRLVYDHGHAAPMENRGVVASWDARAQQLTVWDTTQAPIPIRGGLAGMLGLSEHQVRVVAPYVGGGFGPKIMMFYQEEVLLPWASMQLGRPVKWIEDRRESFLNLTQERSQIHEARLAVDSEGRILGVYDEFLHDTGAYVPYGLTVPINSQCTLLGPYVVPAYYSEFRAVFTNKPIVTPYRGAGRQHGVFVMERLLDLAARELGIDPAEIRRRNFIPRDAFPYDNELIYQDFAPLRYDSGDYEPLLDKALEMIGYRDFVEAGRQQLREEGRCVGIGVVSYVEGTGIGPYEGARVRVQPDGKVIVATGVGTQGQGHYTSFAQVAAEQLGVRPDDITVVTADTSEFHWGCGTFASRGAVVAGSAVHEASTAVRDKALALASERLEADPADLEIADGQVQVRGAPSRAIELGELARLANPMRGAVEPETEPGLEATRYFGPESGTTAAGVHAMVVEVDPQTATVEILRYVVVHDCGVVINPMIVEGQVMGGVAQGIGNAHYEQIVFDEWGQPQTTSFMDYLVPTAMEVPHMEIGHRETPSPWNPMGVKGVGEAGAIPVGALFAQAVEDALRDLVAAGDGAAIEVLEIPLTPNRLFGLLRDAGLTA